MISNSNLEQSTPVAVTSSDAIELRQSDVPEQVAGAPPGIVATGTARDRRTRIAVDAWLPKREYLAAFDADPASFDQLFVEWERKAGGVPSFYLDSADWLVRHNRSKEAIETLLSALDLPSANAATLGLVAARLNAGASSTSPSRFASGRCCSTPIVRNRGGCWTGAGGLRRTWGANGAPTMRRDRVAQHHRASSHIAAKDRYRVIRAEANALIRARAWRQVRWRGHWFAIGRRPASSKVDGDHAGDRPHQSVDEQAASGDHSNPKTHMGGRLSNDMTNGFGPEDYWIRRAPDGSYEIRANTFRSDAMDPNGASRITARLIRDFGRPTEREEFDRLRSGRGSGKGFENWHDEDGTAVAPPACRSRSRSARSAAR